MKINFPDEISYFQTVLEKLNEYNPEELHEDNQEALGLIEAAISTKIKDLSDDEAINLIKRHKILLDNIKEEFDMVESFAYLEGVILGMLAFKYNDYSALTGE